MISHWRLYSLIFIELDVEVIDKKLEGECDFCDNWRTIRHIVIACVSAFLAQFLYFLAVSDEIQYRRPMYIVVEQLSVFEKNWHRKGRPLRKVVMQLCSYFDFSSDRVGIHCRRSPLEAIERL
jgi:phage-related holin